MKESVNIPAKECCDNKDYIEAVKIGLAQPEKSNFECSEAFTVYFLNIVYSLYSCSELKLYNEFEKLFNRYSLIVNRNSSLEPPNGYYNHACLLQHYIIVLVFKHYNDPEYYSELNNAVSDLKNYVRKTPNPPLFKEQNEKLEKLVQTIIDGRLPYFTIEFKLPLSLPVPDGKYKIESICNASSISVEHFVLKDVSSKIGDRHFSKIKIVIFGFTNTDNYWAGPDLTNICSNSYNNERALKIVNEIIFRLKLVDKSLRLDLITIDDMGTVTTEQFCGDGSSFHFSMSLGMGGHALTNILSKQELNEASLEIFKSNINSETLQLYQELYSRSLIEISNLDYVSGFFQINSACEAMIDYYLNKISVQNDAEELFKEMHEGKSICSECSYFLSIPSQAIPPRKAMPPSPMQQVKLLKQLDLVTSSKLKVFQKNISKIRNDSLRNDLFHGKKTEISRESIETSVKCFDQLERDFQELLSQTNE